MDKNYSMLNKIYKYLNKDYTDVAKYKVKFIYNGDFKKLTEDNIYYYVSISSGVVNQIYINLKSKEYGKYFFIYNIVKSLILSYIYETRYAEKITNMTTPQQKLVMNYINNISNAMAEQATTEIIKKSICK